MPGVGMKDAGHVRPGRVYAGVDVERRVDIDVLAGKDVEVEIRFVDQRRRDFVETEIVDVEEERLRLRQPRREVTAHAAGLSQHVDDLESEQQFLTKPFGPGFRFPYFRHAQTGHPSSPVRRGGAAGSIP